MRKVRVLKFKSKIKTILPTDEKKLLNEENLTEFVNKWFSFLVDDIKEFYHYYQKNNFHELNLNSLEIFELIQLTNKWLTYIHNILVQFTENIDISDDIQNFLGANFPYIVLQISETIIISLNDFKPLSKRKHFNYYINNSVDQIFNDIIENKSDLLLLTEQFKNIPLNNKNFFEITSKIRIRIARIRTLYNSLIDLEKKKDDSLKLDEYLLEYKLHRASDRLKSAYKFLVIKFGINQ